MTRKLALLLSLTLAGCGGTETATTSGGPPAKPEIHCFAQGSELTGVTRVFFPEQVTVKLQGFTPGAQVTLDAAMPGYASHATFHVGADGTADTAAQAPLEGTYQGADADGLFWSMLPEGAPPAAGSTDIDVDITASVDGQAVAERKLGRFITADGIVETPVSDDGLVAVFVTPATPGPHPAMLTFGGSEGGIESGQKYARFYASLGYSCLGIAYFAAQGLPTELADVPLEYFATALAWLKKRPEVKPDAIGVLGASRGGELALLLGATFPDVKAVVAQVPSGVVWPGYDFVKGIVSSWTYNGMELPFVPPSTMPPPIVKEDGHNVKHYTPTFNASLDAASPAALDAATTRVEKAAGPILMIAGADDQLWPSCRLAKIAMDRLTAAGHDKTFPDAMECYPDAGHGIGAPGYPTTGPNYLQHPITKEWISLGGTPAGLAHADRDAFEKKRAFLAKALP